MTITHYGLFRASVPESPQIKEASLFESQGGLIENWGKTWEAIHDASSIGDARRKFAQSKGTKLSSIYWDEK